MYVRRRARVAVLEALEARVRQFRSHDDLFGFRVPHDPLDLEALIEAALADHPARIAPADLRSRPVMRLEFPGGETWDAWVITLASDVHVYCDDDGHESRVLASLRRGHPLEADRFFLELLADTRGHAFGIEMGVALPARVRTPIDDRGFLADVFVELFEGTPVEALLREPGDDFRDDVERWLERVLVAPPPAVKGRRRLQRLRDEDRQ